MGGDRPAEDALCIRVPLETPGLRSSARRPGSFGSRGGLRMRVWGNAPPASRRQGARPVEVRLSTGEDRTSPPSPHRLTPGVHQEARFALLP